MLSRTQRALFEVPPPPRTEMSPAAGAFPCPWGQESPPWWGPWHPGVCTPHPRGRNAPGGFPVLPPSHHLLPALPPPRSSPSPPGHQPRPHFSWPEDPQPPHKPPVGSDPPQTATSPRQRGPGWGRGRGAASVGGAGLEGGTQILPRRGPARLLRRGPKSRMCPGVPIAAAGQNLAAAGGGTRLSGVFLAAGTEPPALGAAQVLRGGGTRAPTAAGLGVHAGLGTGAKREGRNPKRGWGLAAHPPHTHLSASPSP